jgi:hypothetical protein
MKLLRQDGFGSPIEAARLEAGNRGRMLFAQPRRHGNAMGLLHCWIID